MGGGLRMASQSAGNVLFLDVDCWIFKCVYLFKVHEVVNL